MEQINSHWSLETAFQEMRNNKNTHLGLGDIRLTMGAQEEIVKLSEKQKLKSVIEKLNELDSIFQAKYKLLPDPEREEYLIKASYLDGKRSGINLAREEIRREINDLTNLISQLWSST